MADVIFGIVAFLVVGYVIHYVWEKEDKLAQDWEDDGK